MSRSFKVINILSKDAKISSKGGRYKSKTPANAARKAFNQIFRKINKDFIKSEITIKETTRNSSKKEYSYLFTRIKKLRPLEIKKNNKNIKINYKTLKNFTKKDYMKLKSNKYVCSKKEKQDSKLKTCCTKFNSKNYRTYQSCIKHIKK